MTLETCEHDDALCAFSDHYMVQYLVYILIKDDCIYVKVVSPQSLLWLASMNIVRPHKRVFYIFTACLVNI